MYCHIIFRVQLAYRDEVKQRQGIMGQKQVHCRWVVYQHHPYSLAGPRVVIAAFWAPQDGLTTTSHKLHQRFRWFQHGASLLVTATHSPPLCNVMQDSNHTERSQRQEESSLNFKGPMPNMLAIIAKKLNFTCSGPRSLRPSTLVTPALHPGHSGPPPWSFRPTTPVNAAFYSSFIYL
ncbi:hypothetical protein Pmani_013764 [Petrolisthes manimaculis]|uniref:Uncharacterized protein n=1 Tax=Petrolisthes manimaculis TaxID=1843537 RepID=A0AAE1PVQ6_9EUCA|nr:hypothetical protein Pmani_013764 [Petrolisthes manimaculis]